VKTEEKKEKQQLILLKEREKLKQLLSLPVSSHSDPGKEAERRGVAEEIAATGGGKKKNRDGCQPIERKGRLKMASVHPAQRRKA